MSGLGFGWSRSRWLFEDLCLAGIARNAIEFIAYWRLVWHPGRAGVPGLAPAGDSLSLASPRESKQREGEPDSSALRARCVAQLRRGARKLGCASNMRTPRSAEACATRLLITAREPDTENHKDAPWRVLGSFEKRSCISFRETELLMVA